MKNLIFCLLTGIIIWLVWFNWHNFCRPSLITPINSKIARPLLQYTYQNLHTTTFKAETISLGKELSETDDYSSYLFYYSVPSQPSSRLQLKVSGLLNIPKQPGIYPVIVLIRGYVDQNNYQTGVGTKRVGEELAKNGFITLAPDFLGYGESDNPSSDVFEERFQTYTTTLTLLASLKNLNSALLNKGLTDIKADNQIGIWGHSNGGQIALSVLEIAGKNYPTVLWAPVSKPFPYSILYYTDEAEDQGKMLRQKLAQFESNYDVIKYSPNNYYSWIKAPLQIHQGLLDEAVPTAWSDKLVAALEKEKIKVEYCQYKDADHNLMPDGWVTAVDRSVKFFQTRLIINK